jgi:GAF domain-containing protein
VSTLETEQARAQAAASYRAVAIQCKGLTRLARLAATLLRAPAAVITIVDQERIWLEARHGVDVKFAPLEPGLCASCILQDGPWVISDAAPDCRTKANSLVNGPLGVRSYLGVPLRTAAGHNIGALAIINFEPRQPTELDITSAQDLATVVMQSLEHKRRLETARAQGANELAQREQREARIRVLMRELAHRSKNLLAVVQAIARQTAGPNPLVQQYADGLSQRIQALADAHEPVCASS